METKTVTIPLDDHFQESIDRLVQEGWAVTPGTQPQATYQLTRIPASAGAGHGGFGIREDKITIIKGVN